MTDIAFFAPNATDAAVVRRIASMHANGLTVTGLTMRRDDAVEYPWRNIDLGCIRDGDFAGRMSAIRTATLRALKHRATLEQADVFYARNLDMLAIASRVLAKMVRPKHLVYECLDIHQLMTGAGPVAIALRWLERSLLNKTELLVYSSPAFEEYYFRRFHPGRYYPFLLENRLVESDMLSPRPGRSRAVSDGLTIGWVGILRCRRSLAALCALAEQFQGQVEVVLHGKPSRRVLPDFDEIVSRNEHLTFHGSYRYPQDLEPIYQGMDLVWAGDWFQSGFNSTWLLPNRIYEGGYFAVPPVASAGTQTAKWVSRRQSGFVIDEPIEESLPQLISQLLEDKGEIHKRMQKLLDLPRETFVEPGGEMRRLVGKIGHGCNLR